MWCEEGVSAAGGAGSWAAARDAPTMNATKKKTAHEAARRVFAAASLAHHVRLPLFRSSSFGDRGA
jgi:hypothetical protein